MKKTLLLFISLLCIADLYLYGQEAYKDNADYPIQQVSLSQVNLTDAFWLPKIQTIQKKTIQYAFDKCDTEGRFENFITAGKAIKGEKGTTRGKMPFDDTDVYKTIEGAAYSLISAPDPALDHYLDSIISIIRLGQEPDGYLTTWRTIDPMHPSAGWVKPGNRWTDLGASHELYNSGHLFEAASAHYHATGKRDFLNIALKNADLLVKVFGDSANYEVPGHQIVETGLIKLYQITHKKDYLKLAKKFLDLRGDTAHRKTRGAYSQDHLPVSQQDEVVGHAVRAVYMYAGMTDIAAIYRDSAYLNAVDKLWDNMVNKKMYVTGGLGARHDGESFGDNYELPNLTAYSETCAAIGSVYWNERLFRLTDKSKYYDIIERTLYNALISGISLEGTEFFYPNPLESDGKYAFNMGARTRQPWFDCSCCPTNLIRFIPYIPNLIYATQDNSIYINLFMSNKASIPLQGNNIEISQETAYPWNGNITINVNSGKNQTFSLKLRIPGWALNQVTPGSLYTYKDESPESYRVLLNGEIVETQLRNGYFEITREWKNNDRIELSLPMKVRQVAANGKIADDVGLFSVEYGPLVYCLEEIANNNRFDFVPVTPQTTYSIEMKPYLLDGINIIQETTAERQTTLIPYYAWSNKSICRMKVWR
ncbi:Non-reducing end beta-L-arabinofuranosidase [termite gut metagenome]|uniref:Non-reducing end beta-L-arabinofuranosidase n=1 Tax=termite gut metagenome TaxID=433724 RepID=A0A5J4SVK6_9ZZZZ